MPWTALTEAAALKEGFNPSEQAALTAAGGAVDGFADILTAAILEARGICEGAGYTLDADVTKLPDALRPHVIALARWRWLIGVPDFPQMQTEARKLAAERAEEVLDKVAEGDFPIAPPVESTTPAGGDHGTETKIQMRTSRTAQE